MSCAWVLQSPRPRCPPRSWCRSRPAGRQPSPRLRRGGGGGGAAPPGGATQPAAGAGGAAARPAAWAGGSAAAANSCGVITQAEAGAALGQPVKAPELGKATVEGGIACVYYGPDVPAGTKIGR